MSRIGDAIITSGSSLLTLGFLRPPAQFGEIIAFVEAAIGLALVALLISYLPTIYSAFSRRELLVNLLEVRADSPPSPVVMITRMHRLSGLDALHDLWERWEQWFSEVEETHSSLPVLVFYRSQQHDHSWVNAAGAVMDGAALMRSAVAAPWDVQADLTIRAGYIALRRIATYFRIDFDAHPGPMDATSVVPCAVRRGPRRPGVVRGAAGRGPRPGLARLQRLAGELRRGASWPREADDGADAVVGPPDALGVGDRRAAARRGRPGGAYRRDRRPTRPGRADPGGGYPASLNPVAELNPDAATSPAVTISATITPRTPTPHIRQSIGPSASRLVGMVVVAMVIAVIGRGPVAALDGVGRAVLVSDRVLVVGVGHRASLPPCATHCPTREP